MHRALSLTPQSGAWDFSLTLRVRAGLYVTSWCEITSCLKIMMAGIAGRLYCNCEVVFIPGGWVYQTVSGQRQHVLQLFKFYDLKMLAGPWRQ